MSLEHLGRTAAMGPELQAEVERQLLEDLATYGVDPGGLRIDWSAACQEGHCTTALDGNLEELSSVAVVDADENVADENVVAEGWMDFIHGGEGNPLFVFWLFLRVRQEGEWIKVKAEPDIPPHVWARLPETSKRLCTRRDAYDARWKDDPLVLEWKRANAA